MNKSLVDKKEKRRVTLTLALSAFLLFSLSSFLVKPLYISAANDVLYMNTALIPAMEILILLLDTVSYAVCFAAVIYSVFAFTLKGAVGSVIVCASAFLFKNLAAFVMDSVSATYVDIDDLWLNLLYFGIDLAKLALVLFPANAFIKSFRLRRAELEKQYIVLGKKLPPLNEELFSAKALYSRSNPLHRAALLSAIVILSTELLSETLFYIASGFFTSASNTLWMFADYLSDVILAVVIYALSLFIFSRFNSKATQLNQDCR